MVSNNQIGKASRLPNSSWMKFLCRLPGIYRNEENNSKDQQDFPGGTVVKNPPANAGDTGSSPGLGRPHMPRSN